MRGLLSSGEYEEATENFDETMADALKAEELRELWEKLEDEFGRYFGKEYESGLESEEHQVILIKGIFNDKDVIFQIAFNEDNEIAGFYVI